MRTSPSAECGIHAFMTARAGAGCHTSPTTKVPPAETLGRPLGHVRRKVDPHEGAARDLVEDDFGEGPGPAPQVQHAGRVDAAARPGDLARHDAVEPPRMVPLHSGVVGLSLGVERCPRPRLQLVCVLLFHVAPFY